MELKEASVLLVEDEPVLREIMAAWLERVTGKVFTAEHGREAVELLATHKINLVLSDVRMPGMNGIELLKWINAAPEPRPRMILITGFSDLALRDALAMGVEAILEKPIKREELLQVAQVSVSSPQELWRQPSESQPEIKIRHSFDNLASALEKNNIGFGRRGFCLETAQEPREGPVEFELVFQQEPVTLSGQGVVRWVAPEEKMAGIEITWLREPGRTWLCHYVEQNRPQAVIPHSARQDHTTPHEKIA
jgi:CheY-like chemotaxis protein